MPSPIAVFSHKELREFLRSWRFPVLGGFLGFFALASPLLAYYTPQIIGSMSGMMGGVEIKIPPPSWADSYAQWIKNLGQIGTFLVAILGAGMVAGEVASGTAVLVLTKPLPRGAFVAVKALSLMVLVAVPVMAGTAIVQALTLAIFGSAPAWPLWSASLAWMASAAWLICLEALLSSLLPTLAAAGLGILAFLLVSVANLWKVLEAQSFSAYFSAPAKLCMGEWVDLGIPAISLAGTALLLLAAAVLVFRRREI